MSDLADVTTSELVRELMSRAQSMILIYSPKTDSTNCYLVANGASPFEVKGIFFTWSAELAQGNFGMAKIPPQMDGHHDDP